MPSHTLPKGPAPEGLALFIDLALPQTQCGRCGYPDCASYAQAIAQGAAGINQCPPGGAEGVQRLSAITGAPVQPLDPKCGVEGPLTVARIEEDACIGCTLCIKACPVDAILGASKRMHTVMAVHCTGCELCIAACPVDCIALDVVTPGRSGWQAWSVAQAAQARARYTARQARRALSAASPPSGAALALNGPTTPPPQEDAIHPTLPAQPPAPAATPALTDTVAVGAQPVPQSLTGPPAAATAGSAQHRKAAIAAALAKARALRGG